MTSRADRAAMEALFAPLEHAYTDRLGAGRAARDRGLRVIGCVGHTVPVELVLAAGAMPLRIAPVLGEPNRADAHVEPFSDRDLRLVFALYVTGELDFLDLLVIPRSSETQHKLYLSLREACRTGLASHGPALWLYDILHTQRESSRTYGLARTLDLCGRLAELTGLAPDDQRIGAAIEQTNALRRELQRLQQRRGTHGISGRQALVAASAPHFMPPAAGAAALHAWLDAEQHLAAPGPRLLATGCAFDHDALHVQVEAAGGNIVAENDTWGSRGAEPLVATEVPPLQAIFEHHWRDLPCVRHHPAQVPDPWLKARLDRQHVDGVLFHLPAPEDVYGWNFPAERDAVAAAGLPWLSVRQDARDGEVPGLADFVASLRSSPV